MTLQKPHSTRIETPIERMFRRTFKRPMTKAERRALHLSPAPIIKNTSVVATLGYSQACRTVLETTQSDVGLKQ